MDFLWSIVRIMAGVAVGAIGLFLVLSVYALWVVTGSP